MKHPIVVSACLLGLATRYDGSGCLSADVIELENRWVLVPVCPEQLGGLPTPRPASEIQHGDGYTVLEGKTRVLRPDGTDVTEFFLCGAAMAAQIASHLRTRTAILKEGSPSCGVRTISRGDKNIGGTGVTAALLRQKGINVEAAP